MLPRPPGTSAVRHWTGIPGPTRPAQRDLARCTIALALSTVWNYYPPTGTSIGSTYANAYRSIEALVQVSRGPDG